MAWRPDTADAAFHLAYDSADPDGTVGCFRAAVGNAELRDGEVYGDTVLTGSAAQAAWAQALADNRATNEQRAADGE